MRGVGGGRFTDDSSHGSLRASNSKEDRPLSPYLPVEPNRNGGGGAAAASASRNGEEVGAGAGSMSSPPRSEAFSAAVSREREYFRPICLSAYLRVCYEPR